MKITVKEAFDLLIDNGTVMVSIELDKDKDLMECDLAYILEDIAYDVLTNIAVLTDEQIEEIWTYLEEKESLELWSL